MIGKVQIVTDDRPHCTNGWAGTQQSPSCNYTGGHFCERLKSHKGKCRCTCGATTNIRPPEDC